MIIPIVLRKWCSAVHHCVEDALTVAGVAHRKKTFDNGIVFRGEAHSTDKLPLYLRQ
jgi:hypothetical protein